MDPSREPLDVCGCCDGVAVWTPMPIENRPRLPAVAYRVGTHGTFRASMQALLSAQPALAALTTRESDDPTIALIDAWATVLDVLTFYQERIANEAFLRTATEMRSVVELAYEIGYVPSPGRAAATFLSFELETGAGAPLETRIPAGTKVQSVPGPDELPHTFETMQDVKARPGWNAMLPQRSSAWAPVFDDTELWLDGTATGLKVGDPILIVGDERVADPTAEEWDLRFLTLVEPTDDGTRTRVEWQRGLGTIMPHYVGPTKENPRVFALRQRAALFGSNAPDVRAMPHTIRARFGAVDDEWPNLAISKIALEDPPSTDPSNTIYLDAIYPKITAQSWVALEAPGHRDLYRPAAVTDSSRRDFTLSSKTTQITFEAGSEHLEDFDALVRETVVLAQSEELAVATVPIMDPVQGKQVTLDAAIDGLQRGMTVLVTGRRPRVRVADDETLDLVLDGGGTITIQPREELSVMAPTVIGTSGDHTWTLRTADGKTGKVTILTDVRLVVPIPARSTDDLLAESATLADLADQPDPLRTTLTLSVALTSAYDRATCVISANVALATHGETKHEVLGSGDASRAFQTFGLKQSPLTYVPSSSSSGSANTLDMRVDGVTWEEEPSLYGLGPQDRAYVVRIADDGATTIEFGNGEFGARLPTGRENVAAAYRVGTGVEGNVEAGKLSLLVTRPLGVSKVANPVAASGGADPEGLEDARQNAPRTLLTLDRAVSLTDHEDFARSFAGVAKAQATWLWDGETRLVFVTVAGIDGAAIDHITMSGLVKALRDAGDPRRAFRVETYEALTFQLAAGVWLLPDYDWERVNLDAVAALRDAFSFRRRNLGQSVTASEVIATIQAVEGVQGVDLDDLRVFGQGAPADPILQASPARWDGAVMEPAQLLSIGPSQDAITLEERA